MWESEENVFFRLSKYAGAAARALRGATPNSCGPESRLRRGRLLRRGGPERSLGLALEGAVGHPVSRAPRPRRLRLARRARELHHRARVRRRTDDGAVPASSGTTRRPSASTSSARTSCASTRSTGRRSCSRPACRCRRPSGRTAGGCATRRRSRSRWATSCGPMTWSREFGPDALRYFLLREMAFGQDASFSDEAFLTATTPTSPTTSGNTVSRVAALCRQSFGGTPEGGVRGQRRSCAPTRRGASDWEAAMGECAFNRALEAVWKFLAEINGYIVTREPWKIRKEEGAGLADSSTGCSRRRPRECASLRCCCRRSCRRRAGRSSRPSVCRAAIPSPRTSTGAGLRVSAPMPERPALFPRVDAEAYFKGKDAADDRTDAGPRRPPAAALRRPRPSTTGSRSRSSRRSACDGEDRGGRARAQVEQADAAAGGSRAASSARSSRGSPPSTSRRRSSAATSSSSRT